MRGRALRLGSFGRVGVSALWLGLASCSSPDPTTLRRSAQAALEAGQPDRAAADLEALARVVPPTEEDRLLRAQTARARNRIDDARKELAAVPQDHPLSKFARLMEGQIELRLGRLRLAEEGLRAAVKLDPDLVQAHRELIYVYGMQLRRRELAEEFRALARLGPLVIDQAWLWSMSADLIWWEPKENEKELADFLSRDPEDRWTRLALAENKRRLGYAQEAEDLLKALPENDPEAAAARALLALDRGDVEEAERLVSRADPENPAVARMLGRIALGRRDAPAALKALSIAFKQDPSRRDAVAALGNAYRLAGNEELAKRHQIMAQRLDHLGNLLGKVQTTQGRADKNLPRDLGAACENVGRLDEARAWYRIAVANNPLDRESQLALHRLDQPAKSEP